MSTFDPTDYDGDGGTPGPGAGGPPDQGRGGPPVPSAQGPPAPTTPPTRDGFQRLRDRANEARERAAMAQEDHARELRDNRLRERVAMWEEDARRREQERAEYEADYAALDHELE